MRISEFSTVLQLNDAYTFVSFAYLCITYVIALSLSSIQLLAARKEGRNYFISMFRNDPKVCKVVLGRNPCMQFIESKIIYIQMVNAKHTANDMSIDLPEWHLWYKTTDREFGACGHSVGVQCSHPPQVINDHIFLRLSSRACKSSSIPPSIPPAASA
jgi:hypothetical protein